MAQKQATAEVLMVVALMVVVLMVAVLMVAVVMEHWPLWVGCYICWEEMDAAGSLVTLPKPDLAVFCFFY